MRAVGVWMLLLCSILAWAFLPRGPIEMPVHLTVSAFFAAGAALGIALLISPARLANPCSVFLCVWLVIGIYLFATRVQFIFENGGMEPPDGYGSPLAFLIGWISEQLFSTVPALGLLLVLRRKLALTSASPGTQATS